MEKIFHNPQKHTKRGCTIYLKSLDIFVHALNLLPKSKYIIVLINTIKTLKRSRDINQLSVVTKINRETHYSQNELNFSSYFSSTK